METETPIKKNNKCEYEECTKKLYLTDLKKGFVLYIGMLKHINVVLIIKIMKEIYYLQNLLNVLTIK